MKKHKDYFKKHKTVSSLCRFGKKSTDSIDISICIPTFHRPELLEECIQSCLKQKSNHLSVEILVVDNNIQPENENLKLIRKLARPEVCYYQNEENIGIFGNWNRCIELAQGTWVSLLHDDDLLAPDCFYLWEKLLSSPKLPDHVAYIKTVAIDFIESQENLNLGGIKNMMKRKYKTAFYQIGKFDLIAEGVPGKYGMPTAGTLMRRDAIIRIGGYNTESFFPSEDVFVPVRLFDNGYHILSTIAPFGYYRCAVNESMKKEIHIGWVQDFVRYRSQARAFGGVYQKYEQFFRDTQLYCFCQYILKRYVPEKDWNQYFEPVPEVKQIEVKRLRIILYKLITRLHDYSFYLRALF